jgi:alkylation response protein AidB-like acyl-CoA dehydrogenase
MALRAWRDRHDSAKLLTSNKRQEVAVSRSSHYRSNLADIDFMLFDVLQRDELLGKPPFDDLDLDTARIVLAEAARLAGDEIAASFAAGDRNPPEFDPATHRATLPAEFKASYRAWMDAEFWRLGIEPAVGGQPCPPSLTWALAELVLGANPALFFYASGPRFASLTYQLGTPAQRRLAQLMTERGWCATMVLTEPEAGSDVGAGRTTATRQPDGSWHLNGVKRFTTSGEHDLSENIIHYVLARPVGIDGVGGPGTKGLSLFLVPKFAVDLDTGELGERNGVLATNVEHKMGLKVSTTCELTFGADRPAVGWLLGDVHDGIRQMFQVIEYARMLVGTKAIATLSTGYLNALEYAKQRVQGADLTRQADKTAPRVPIIRHPDVRRSLMTQKAYAEGLRALVLYTASVQDEVTRTTAEGAPDADAVALNDLLLPLVKGYGSERAWVVLGTESLQTFGGSGFISDFPLEQYVRDAKIDTLYEGTTAIQGLDLFFRKIVRDRGRALGRLSAEIGAFVQADGGGGAALADERTRLGRAVADAENIVGRLVSLAAQAQGQPPLIYRVGANTSRLLLALGDVVVGWLLLRQAEVAAAQLAAGVDRDGRTLTPGAAGHDLRIGKIAAARWFAREVLPEVSVAWASVRDTDDLLTDLPDSAF